MASERSARGAGQRRRKAGLAAALAMSLWLLITAESNAQDASALRARHDAMRSELANNAFQRPLHMESVQQGDELAGHAFAIVDQPFVTVTQALRKPDHWCDILMLHLDVKSCEAGGASGRPAQLKVATTRKYDQPLSSAHWVEFEFQPESASSDYLQVKLHAETGPMSTHNYRIVLEAIPLDAKRSFVHLAFSYESGLAARIAMEGYFATFGRNKVGFSVVDTRDGKPVYVGNVRGLIERNTMRYYLAIDAFLAASALPPSEQLEHRLHVWFDSAERYPVQLHEMGRDEYLSMKRKEIQSQPAARPG